MSNQVNVKKRSMEPISTDELTVRSEKSKKFFTRSVTALRVIGGIISLLLSIAMIAGLIYAIVVFFRADWLQSLIK